jgi:ribosomal protein S18 acetylase RimI-like enzyme
MEFDLTREMIDKIGFAMEDQGERFLIDADTGELVSQESVGGDPEGEKYVPLPRWGSAEGFHMMESFVTSLRNPVYRELLASALGTGKGVFRAFKDTLKKNHEIEKLWFHYKERRLRSVIIAWYNANREARGLSKLPPEPEETGELVATDFSFAWGAAGYTEEILRLDEEAFRDLFPAEDPEQAAARFRAKRGGMPSLESASSVVLCGMAPAGELAGFAWGILEGSSVHLAQLAVVKELRGIGIGDALLRRFVTGIRERGVSRLTTELAGKALRYSMFFRSLGFTPVSEVLECGIDDLP